MLTIFGRSDRKSSRCCGRKSSRCCDGYSRRNFLKVGGMALGGLALPQVLRAESEAGTGGNHRAIINIYLPGGPSHLDLWDLKPEAPEEIRGEFKPIPTNVPGIEICELFPRMAQMMDKFIPVRSISDADGRHDAYQCMTGRRFGDRRPPGGWPSAGGFVSKLQGPANTAVPPNGGVNVSDRPPRMGRTGHGRVFGASAFALQSGGTRSPRLRRKHGAARH